MEVSSFKDVHKIRQILKSFIQEVHYHPILVVFL